MDITSYLLGKKSSGGGSSGLDWSAIGYSKTPQALIDDYNYSLEIKKNWTNEGNIQNKFKSNLNLKYMPLVDTSNAIYVSGLFEGCSYLQVVPELTISSNVTNLSSFFADCVVLKEVDLSNWDTSNVTSMSKLFSGCSRLTKLDLSSFYTPKLTSLNYTFNNCLSLTQIDMRNFDFTTVTNKFSTFSSVPTSCLIIVKDQTQKEWFTTNFASLTNVKTVDEYNAM